MNSAPEHDLATAEHVRRARQQADEMIRDLPPQDDPHEWCMTRLMAHTLHDLAGRVERRAAKRAERQARRAA